MFEENNYMPEEITPVDNLPAEPAFADPVPVPAASEGSGFSLKSALIGAAATAATAAVTKWVIVPIVRNVKETRALKKATKAAADVDPAKIVEAEPDNAPETPAE